MRQTNDVVRGRSVSGDLYYNRMGDRGISTARFSLLFDGKRWKTDNGRGTVYTAKGIHIFVVQGEELHICKRRTHRATKELINHIDLAHDRPVQFAGEIRFGSRRRRGILLRWTDQTGHFHDPARPMDPDVVPILPPEAFERYEELR